MSNRRLFIAPALVVILAACSGGASSPGATSPPDATGPAPADAPATRIEVELTDAFEIVPAAMTVPAGVPVTFVVHNAGALEHEFFLGDEAAQAEHEQEMAEVGMAHDDPNGISVPAGETKELTFTFEEAGATLAGCHEPGHYGAGMKASITVVAD